MRPVARVLALLGLAASTEASVKCSITATSGNVVAGDLCDLPFFYNGIRHDQATTEYNGVASCPTVTAWDKSADSSYWGPASCFDATCVTSYTEHSGGSAMPAGIACSFPFVFNGITYYSCAKNQYKDTGSDVVGWCAVGADSSGEGWGWAQWGDCDCTGTGNPVPPAPPSPSPPSPGPPSPSPPSPHPPSPSPPTPGNGGQTGDSDVDSVAVTFGTISVLVFAAVCVVVVYRRRRRLASDMGDLAPWGFEKQALLRGGSTGGSQSGRPQSKSYESPNAAFGGLDMSGANENRGPALGLGMFQPPPMNTSPAGKYPGSPAMSPMGNNPMGNQSMHGGYGESSLGGGMGGPPMGMGGAGILPMGSPHSVLSHPGSHQSAHAPPIGAATPGSQASHSTHYSDYMHQDDWIQTEAAAAKMRSCFIKKSPGDRIGLRLLNFMGRNTRGVCVVGVKPDTAGALAGIEEGDMIVEIDCRSVLNLTHEQVLDMLVNAGDAYSIIVSRG